MTLAVSAAFPASAQEITIRMTQAFPEPSALYELFALPLVKRVDQLVPLAAMRGNRSAQLRRRSGTTAHGRLTGIFPT